MIDGEMRLEHASAVRAAAGLTDVGATVAAAALALSAVVSELSWGGDAVGAALVARHGPRQDAVAAALPAVAASLRDLDDTVRAGAGALVGTDQRNSSAVVDASEGRA
ncbi:MAG: hypothetical protein ACXVGN_03660 [Mycobacteriaceae bacterium]